MGARGPQAQASQGLMVIGGNGIEAVRRPDPPCELTDEMAHEWQYDCESYACRLVSG
jgi:hypothetical protein